MPQNFVEAPEKKAGAAWVPLIGFLLLIVLAAISYLLAPAFHGWLTSAEFAVAGTQVLPLNFPTNWTDQMIRIAVAFMLWLMLFAIAMFIMLMAMGSPMKEDDVSLAAIRKEKEKELGRKIRK